MNEYDNSPIQLPITTTLMEPIPLYVPKKIYNEQGLIGAYTPAQKILIGRDIDIDCERLKEERSSKKSKKKKKPYTLKELIGFAEKIGLPHSGFRKPDYVNYFRKMKNCD